MKPARRLIPWLSLVLIGCLIWMFRPKDPASATDRNPTIGGNPGLQQHETASPDDAESLPSPGPHQETSPAEVKRLLARCLEAFKNSRETTKSLAILKELRDGIHSSNPASAVSAIHDFLMAGQDAPTQLAFVVAPGGVMETTPTLRTALLDLLPALDPTQALQISREIMDSKKSSDEFALALRNLAWNDLDGDLNQELSDRFKQMIETGAWSSDPSAGFLEAMDAAVAISDENAFRAMLELGAKAESGQNRVLARAVIVALDRMVIREPTLLVDSFARDPGLSGIAPDQRASLMSRLDLGVPAQRAVFARYLAGSDHGDGELDYFAELFPNANYLHGNWLITSLDSTLSAQARLAADRKTLAELNRMIAADQRSNQAIVRIRDRLQQMFLTSDHE